MFEIFNNDNNITYNNEYKYLIIIATNIAEASITIPLLYYVIDTAFYKLNTYEKKNKKLSILKIMPISESNRIQRRGRVGIISSGEIYYMYDKESRKDDYQ